MIEASKTAELSSQPRKRAWKAWMFGLAGVVAVVTIALLAIAPRKEPVRVWFVRATNEGGEKKLVFEATNGTGRGIELMAFVSTGPMGEVKTPPVIKTVYGWSNVIAASGTSLYFTLNAPSNDLTYSVLWKFHRMGSDATPWERIRSGCFYFFRSHGMFNLAERFAPGDQLHYIPSTEIKE